MNDTRKISGMGVGYVTLIMLFAVICLTMLASLSYQAARANDKLNEKSVYYTSWYYAADAMANEVLCTLDEAAYEAHETGFFADSFESICDEKLSAWDDNTYAVDVAVKRIPEGFRASYFCPIAENNGISVEIVFLDVTRDGERYRVDTWKTVAVSENDENETLGVWDGSALG